MVNSAWKNKTDLTFLKCKGSESQRENGQLQFHTQKSILNNKNRTFPTF